MITTFQYPDINPDVLNPREVYEVKLLMAYFLNQTDRPCTAAELNEIFTGEGIVDYFLYTEALKEMLETGTLVAGDFDGVKKYTLSEKGRAGADSFKRFVPKSVRDRIRSSGLRLFAKQKTQQSVKTEITGGDGEYYVSCSVNDNGAELMQLKLFAPDKEQAEHIRSQILANPTELYGRILDYVVCAEEEYPDPFEN